ncbi:MAG: sulfite exporter TauE/SafE family protein [Salibacteraceae bacterium]
MYLVAAISIGLLGSAHCAGMCGPILLTVNQGQKKPLNDVLHHSGRLLTYALFGAVAGALGNTFSIMGWQQDFSITVGLLMVLSVLLIPLSRRFKAIESVLSRVAIKFTGWIHRAGFGKNQLRFLTGVANGLLPCGLVYLAVAGAANTFTPWDGALFMLAFGAGTLPTLLIVSAFGQKLNLSLRNRLRKLIPITVFVMGCLLIVRGMNLGIPYVSPQQQADTEEVADCG